METEQQVIPRILQLSEHRPPAVNCSMKRYPAVQNPSAVVNVAGSESIIPIDTFTMSAFLEPRQTYLQFELKVINPNPFIDYFNLGPGGVASFIDKIQIRSQGSMIEEIQQYGTMFEHWLEKEGNTAEEFHMYTTRKTQLQTGWQWGGQNSLNRVKPPMVDGSGKIMHACTVYNDGHVMGWQRPQLVGDSTYTVQGMFGDTVAPGEGAQAIYYTERGLFTNDGSNYYPFPDGINPHVWPDTLGFEPPSFECQDQVNNCGARRPQDFFSFLANVRSIPIGVKSKIQRDPSTGVYTPYAGVGSATDTVSDRYYEDPQYYQNGEFTAMCVLPILSGVIGLLNPKCLPTFVLNDLTFHIFWSSAAFACQFTMDPCRRIVGTRRDYCVWYGNVLGGIYQSTFLCPDADTTKQQINNITSATSVVTKYGPISQWAQVSNFYNGLKGAVYLTGNDTTLSAAVDGTQYRSVLAHTWRVKQVAAGFYEDSFAPTGTKVVTTSDVGKGGEVEEFMYGGWIPETTALSNGTGADNVGRMAPLVQAPSLNNSTSPAWTSFIMQGKLPQYFIPSMYQAAGPYVAPTYTSSEVTTAAVGKGSTSLCVYNKGLAYTANMLPVQQRLGYSYVAGVSNLMTASQYLGTPNLGNDAMGCFGTFLNASVPQTKRCWNNWNKGTLQTLSDPQISNIQYPKHFAGHQAKPYFEIRKLQLVCHQLILPEKVAATVISFAAKGSIAMETSSCKVYHGLGFQGGSLTQNVILPIYVGIGNTISVMFRHEEQMTGDKMGMYHSTSGFNPFAKISYEHDAYSFTGTNIRPVKVGMSASSSTPTSDSSPWAVQLQVGSDFYPQQEIQDAQELIAELEKAHHSLFSLDNGRAMLGLYRNKALFNTQTWSTRPVKQTEFIGADVSSTTLNTNSWLSTPGNGGAYFFPYHVSNTNADMTEIDIEADNTFWTVWRDPDFLMDQTIINNSMTRYMTNAQNVLQPTLKSWVPVPQGMYHVPSFVTPRSKFFLAFDLDAFSGLSEVTASGMYLGNITITLRLKGFQLGTQTQRVVGTAWVDAQAMMVLEAAGVLRLWI